MKPGDVMKISTFTAVMEGGKLTMRFGRPCRKGLHIFMYMGVELEDDVDPLDLMQVMKQLGWEPRDATKDTKC